MAKMIKFPKREQKDPAIKRVMEGIKWTTLNDFGEPILVGEFQIVGKHNFPVDAKIGKKKLKAEKESMAEDLLMALRVMVKHGEV